MELVKKMIVVVLFFCLTNILVLEAKETTTKKITISAAGDCTFSSDIKQSTASNFYSMYNKKNPKYFFDKVKSIFRKDDLSIVNFEGTLSKRGQRADKLWAFRGKPYYANILNKGSIEAVGFANNHVKDYGEGSYKDTKKVLKKHNVWYSSSDNVCIKKIKGVKVAMLSISSIDVTYNPILKLRELLKRAKKNKPVITILSMHSGTEYTDKATAMQKQLAYIAIDEGGVDLVLGHHPHVIQGIEKRKGAYIVYSLGNFVFGGNSNPTDKDTMIFQQTFTIKNGKLRRAKSKAKVIPCSLSSVSYYNNYQPKIQKGESKKRILARLNAMSKEFKVKIGKNGVILK